MSVRIRDIKKDDHRIAIAAALEDMPVRFNLTEGHIVHIGEMARAARERRMRRR